MFRSVMIYLIVLLLFRAMGKRQLGQMQPFEFVLSLIIADLATIPMAEIAVPILQGIVPVLTLVVFHFVLTFFSNVSIKFGRFISGRPVVVINPNGIIHKSLKDLNLSIDDLSEALRCAGCFSFEQVDYAIMETNGKISILSNKNIEKQEKTLPLNVVCEGQIIEENLKKLEKDKSIVEKIIKFKKSNIKDIIILTLDEKGRVFFQAKNCKKTIFNLEECL